MRRTYLIHRPAQSIIPQPRGALVLQYAMGCNHASPAELGSGDPDAGQITASECNNHPCLTICIAWD